MTAAEIRAEAAKNLEAFRTHVQENLLHPITVADYIARMEIAAQLADMNERERMRPELNDNPKLFCPDCSADLGHFYSNRLRMIRKDDALCTSCAHPMHVGRCPVRVIDDHGSYPCNCPDGAR